MRRTDPVASTSAPPSAAAVFTAKQPRLTGSAGLDLKVDFESPGIPRAGRWLMVFDNIERVGLKFKLTPGRDWVQD